MLIGTLAVADGEKKEERYTVGEDHVPSRFDSKFLAVHSYNQCESGIKSEFENWIASMTPERDFESGGGANGALEWVRDQNATFSDRGVYTTLIFTDNRTGEVVATASLVEDDRGMARKYKLTGGGFWSLVAVRHDLRGRGLGTLIARHLDAHVQRFMDSCKLPCSFYLFTSNPLAVKIYENLGFRYVREIVVDDFDLEESLFEKNYAPSGII